MILLEKQTGLQRLQITSWFTEQIQQVNVKSEDPTKGQKISKENRGILNSSKSKQSISVIVSTTWLNQKNRGTLLY